MAAQYTLFLALLAFTCALAQAPAERKDDGGGCCFYAEKNYQGQSVCSSRPFTSEFHVQSFFCTDGFAGSLRKKNEVIAIVFCADQLPETLQPIDADQIMVSPCPRYQCCFYTEDNLGGDEYCIPDNSPPKLNNVYKSYTCLPSWKPRLNTGADTGCPVPGTSQSFAAPVKHVDIDTEQCPPPANAPRASNDDDLGLAFFEENANMANFEETNFEENANMANFEENSNFGASVEDGFENMANFEENTMQSEVQAEVQSEVQFVANDNAQEDAMSLAEDGSNANLASSDDFSSFGSDSDSSFAMSVEDVQFVEFAGEGDAAAMSGVSETLGNSAAGIASAFVALIVGLALLA